MLVVVDDLLTNYEAVGQGPAILLLHGWGDSSDTYKDLLKQLSTQFRTIALDLPGFGKTEPPKQVWGLEEYADYLNHFLDKIKAVKLYAVVGHSNGGALAIKALSSNQIKSDKLILLAASGVRNKNKSRKLLIKAIAKTGKAATFWLPQQQKNKLQKKLYGVVGSDMLVAPHLQETFKKTVSQDIQDDAKNIKIPTLMIYADNDPAVPVEDGRRLHSLIVGSEFKVLPQAGHFVHQDEPHEVFKLIEKFLDDK